MIRTSTLIPVTDASSVASARRSAQDCAFELEFSEQGAGRVSLVVTELATNLVKHGGGGSIVLSATEGEPRSLDILALDRGSGIRSLPAAMRDGFSTAGSPGTGLGAIQRQSTRLDIYSPHDQGTAIYCRVDDDSDASNARGEFVPKTPLEVAGICVPKSGEQVSGDGWSILRSYQHVTVVVVDGLGHGPSAAEAAERALGVFHERERDSIEDLLRDMHEPLRATRGAAVSIARVHLAARKVEFVGAGNVSGSIVDEATTRRTVSHAGTVGAEMRKVQMFTYPWSATSVLVMHSDGLGTSWSFDSYPGLQQRSPAIIAGVLFRDFCRGRDDATVVVAKA